MPRLASSVFFGPMLALALACSPASERSETTTAQDPGSSTPRPDNPASAPDNPGAAWLADRAASTLAGVLGEVGVTAQAEGSQITAGDHTLDLRAQIEHDAVHEGDHVLAATLHLAIDSDELPAFRAQVVGVGPDLEAARRSAIAEWSGEFGSLIGFAIAEVEFHEQFHGPSAEAKSGENYIRMLIDGTPLYLSPVGLRGAAQDVDTLTQDAWTEPLARLAIEHAQTSPRYRGVAIEVKVDREGTVSPMAFIDGLESADLARALARLEWPAGAPTYIYKQFFMVLAPA